MIVDSCLDRNSRRPIALQYLQELAIDVSTAVRLFVVTHWHDDHINGAADILDACGSASFVCSAALNSEGFLQLVYAYGERSQMLSSGLDEFRGILYALERRASNVRRESVGPVWAISDRKLLALMGNGRPFQSEVIALSPSDAAMTLAFREIAQLLPIDRTQKRRVIAKRPNNASVALWVTLGDIHCLLGSDLENQPNKLVGWQAVVLSPTRPRRRALVAKAPHHGSSNAYCREMWVEMTSDDTIALIAPFSSCKKPLPDKRDIARIRMHTAEIFCTGRPSGWRPPKRDSVVERTMREVAFARCAIHGPMGQVRVRLPVEQGSNNPKIELFDGAVHLG